MTDDPAGRNLEKKGDAGHMPTSEPEFPNLTAIAGLDRQQHVQKSIEAGLTREQAEKHADDHMRSWSPEHIENVGE